MNDRKKLISDFEYAVWEARAEGWDFVDLTTKDGFEILDMLKAQEPVKPVPAIDDVDDWLCGNCYQSIVGEEELDASGFVPVKFNFCPNCGRAVDWRADDD